MPISEFCFGLLIIFSDLLGFPEDFYILFKLMSYLFTEHIEDPVDEFHLTGLWTLMHCAALRTECTLLK